MKVRRDHVALGIPLLLLFLGAVGPHRTDPAPPTIRIVSVSPHNLRQIEERASRSTVRPSLPSPSPKPKIGKTRILASSPDHVSVPSIGQHGWFYKNGYWHAPWTAHNAALLRSCEGAYTTNTGNGFFGAYQFDKTTWGGVVQRLSDYAWPDKKKPQTDLSKRYAHFAKMLASESPAWVQDAAARQLHSERGWQPWPGCSRKWGLRRKD